MTRPVMIAISGLTGLALAAAAAPTSQQPRVAPGPNEPDWSVVLEQRFGLKMVADLANPVRTDPLAVPGLFRKAGPGPVTFTPVFALGLETTNRGGWYRPNLGNATPDARPERVDLWSYRCKHTTKDFAGPDVPPIPLDKGSETKFDPGDQPFGLWVANDGLDDSDVYSEPKVVKAVNKRLGKQPYKLMIYPNRDKATGRLIPDSYLLGWEYSTNDDFQDIVARVDNVHLVLERGNP